MAAHIKYSGLVLLLWICLVSEFFVITTSFTKHLKGKKEVSGKQFLVNSIITAITGIDINNLTDPRDPECFPEGFIYTSSTPEHFDSRSGRPIKNFNYSNQMIMDANRCPIPGSYDDTPTTSVNNCIEYIIHCGQPKNDTPSTDNIVLVVHGFMGGETEDYVDRIKDQGMLGIADEYCMRPNNVVIVINWGHFAAQPYKFYGIAAKYVKDAAYDIASKMISCMTRWSFSIERIQCVGFSLGAHVCGTVGFRMRELERGLLGRIDGIDPAVQILISHTGAWKSPGNIGFVEKLFYEIEEGDMNPEHTMIDAYVQDNTLFLVNIHR